MSKTKQNSLMLLSIACILILLLAMSLPNLVLSPGQPFSLGQPQAGAGGAEVLLPGSDIILLVFRGIIGLSLILLPPYIILSLLSKEGRGRLIADIVMIALLLLLAEYLRNHPLGDKPPVQEPSAAASPDTNFEAGPPSVIFQPTPPSWLTPVVILVAAGVIVILLFMVIRYLQRRAIPSGSSLNRLADEAQNAIETLQAGGDFKITVLHCYQEMSRIVREEKGIERDTDMTPREFESRLVEKGLPKEAIRTLTRLFEQARYGNVTSGTREENLAFSCLTEIVNACRLIEGQA
jgi:hypothetical protein